MQHDNLGSNFIDFLFKGHNAVGDDHIASFSKTVTAETDPNRIHELVIGLNTYLLDRFCDLPMSDRAVISGNIAVFNQFWQESVGSPDPRGLADLAASVILGSETNYRALCNMYKLTRAGQIEDILTDTVLVSIPTERSWEVNIGTSQYQPQVTHYVFHGHVLAIVRFLSDMQKTEGPLSVSLLSILARYEWVYEGFDSITNVLQARRAFEQVESLRKALKDNGYSVSMINSGY